MDGRRKRHSIAATSRTKHGRVGSQEPDRKAFSSKYFSAESLLVLLCLTASLLILPVILPTLPPPPLAVLLLPIGILVLLMILAFMPSDVRKIASPCE
ncbi:auxin-regulated protein involved in organ size [Musa troglodytarum]|uniref:Auxin-regulated protein involved in organ size n=1 Tax=Musa troglodytarum TaxID=320322 RepID=A0A9E7K9M2_9LILI|nr:auxin-regulated protein involved in organ size [Musa troglodytarum]